MLRTYEPSHRARISAMMTLVEHSCSVRWAGRLAVGALASLALVTAHPVPEGKTWLTYDGGEGPGKGKHVVLIAADQEYRSEDAMPMLAKVLSARHGFDTTVLFAVNKDGLVDPTMPVYPKRGEEDKFESHNIPGLEHLAKADLVIFFHRLLTLPEEQLAHIVSYLDSGKPLIALRTANHGFRRALPYKINGKERVGFGEIVGGSFRKHHGNWQRDSTRGDIIPEVKDHPILTAVGEIWGTTDVYRTYPEGGSLPEGCTPLVMGQPLIGRERGGRDNPNKIPLPVVWTKEWRTSKGTNARVLHSTMGGASDLKCSALRRLIVNGVYWGMNMEQEISAESSVEIVGDYAPKKSGFAYEKLEIVPKPASAYR